MSLLQTEAITRARQIRVLGTAIELDLSGAASSAEFSSQTTIDFEVTEDTIDTFCDLAAHELIGATLDAVPLPSAAWADRRLALRGVNAGRHQLVVEAVMSYSDDGEGLHRHTDPADGRTYLYAMSFLDAAPRWFACFDQPDLKSPYELTVTVPADWVVRGNGPAEPGAVQGEARTWRMRQDAPLSTYFVTLVAGPYAHHERVHDGVTMGILARASLTDELAAQADDLFEVTTACFDAFAELFSVPYPFGDYHQAFVPDFNAGAMENPGCVTFRDQYIFRGAATTAELAQRASTIAHEMAHQWFGDLVTMRWWDDLWLNESFAEYLGHRVCTDATRYPVWTSFGIRRKDWGSVADQSSATHPIAGNGAADAASALEQFDGISYAKGAAVLRQLATHLGDETFFAGVRGHFETHAFGNATFADLMESWQRAGAQGLQEWAQQWLRTSGMDRLQILPDQQGRPVLHRTPPEANEGTGRHAREAERPAVGTVAPGSSGGSGSASTPARRPHTIEVASVAADGTEVDRRTVTVVEDLTPLDLGPGCWIPDAGDQTWARIGLADWAAVPPISKIADPATRVVLHNALRDDVRNQRLAPAAALELILAAAPHESDDQLLDPVLGFARTELAGTYCPPAQRAGRRGAVSTVAQQILTTADPGSDRQLLALRALVHATDQPDQLDRWLAGDGLPPGLHLDHELRWQMTVRLVSLTADPAVIDRAAAVDTSAAGAVHAARARASVPTTAAKDRAYDLLMKASDLSAYEVYATAAGFFLPEQSELTASYVPRWFADIVQTTDVRTGWALGRVAADSFPMTLPDPAVVALAEQTLAGDLPPALRRAISDGVDQLSRAVAAIARHDGR